MNSENIELREDEVICPVCKGSGKLEQTIYVCEKCDGTGIVDWITNAVTRKKKRSSLDELNVRRVVMHLKSIVNDLQFEPNDKITADNLKGMMENYLDTIQSRKAIEEYSIIQSPDNHLSVHIKPNRSLETVQMDLTIIA
jgi:RecJ-like exonuclease